MNRRDLLESLYARYHHPQFIGHDPLATCYRFTALADREIAGLIAALLAYGNVRAILGGIHAALLPMKDMPHDYLQANSPATIRRDYSIFRYRVTRPAQFSALLVGLKRLIERHGSLQAAFASHLKPEHETLLPAIESWVDQFVKAADDPLSHLLPNPRRGSACKRIMLFLRWMSRHDEIDPGGWPDVPQSKLIIPLDTHVYAMSRKLRLTKRKTTTLQTALDITAALRRMNPDDPLKYDFSMTRPGILRELVVG